MVYERPGADCLAEPGDMPGPQVRWNDEGERLSDGLGGQMPQISVAALFQPMITPAASTMTMASPTTSSTESAFMTAC